MTTEHAAGKTTEIRTDDRKEACKTYVEQTKLLVTLASGFILAPPALLSFIGIKDATSLSAQDIRLFIAAEMLFVLSVLMGYFALASIAGSQDEGLYDIYRPATLWFSRLQIVAYLLGLSAFATMVLVHLTRHVT